MKKLYLKTFLIAAASLFFFACSGGGEKAETNGDADDQTEAADAEVEAATDEAGAIDQLFLAWHQVADYDSWKEVYDGNSDNIRAGGMTQLVLGRGDADPNYVFVGHIVNDLDAAREFIASDDLKEKMEAGGVSQPDVMTFVDVETYGRPYRENLARLMIRHTVADWEAWKAVFDADTENAEANGLSLLFLGRDVDDSNMVSVAFIVQDREKADAYVASDYLKEKMEEAGVEGDVSITFFTVSEYSDLDS